MNAKNIFEVGVDATRHLKHLGILQNRDLTPKEILVFYLRVCKHLTCRAVSRLPLIGGRMSIVSCCHRLSLRHPKYADDLLNGFGNKVQEDKRDEILKKKQETTRRYFCEYRLKQLRTMERMIASGWSHARITQALNLKGSNGQYYVWLKQLNRLNQIGEDRWKKVYRPCKLTIGGKLIKCKCRIDRVSSVPAYNL